MVAVPGTPFSQQRCDLTGDVPDQDRRVCYGVLGVDLADGLIPSDVEAESQETRSVSGNIVSQSTTGYGREAVGAKLKA